MKAIVRERTHIDIQMKHKSRIANWVQMRLENGKELPGCKVDVSNDKYIRFTFTKTFDKESVQKIKDKILTIIDQELENADERDGEELKAQDKHVRAFKFRKLGRRPSANNPLLLALWQDFQALHKFVKNYIDSDRDVEDKLFIVENLEDVYCVLDMAKKAKTNKNFDDIEEELMGLTETLYCLCVESRKFFAARDAEEDAKREQSYCL